MTKSFQWNDKREKYVKNIHIENTNCENVKL